ncbi:multiprotein-bridging factor 1c isoform X2 [Triticum aestivum]|uniref:multiprotein-bridging factor 1c isoform X2 n=1 Tax=Triticum aestivum TaxID=4565 RepID=UPI0003D41FA2|nr:multiprotein-bridging factor 1c-like isoform X2 [Triticum aestivum]
MCYLEVDEGSKLDTICHMTVALHPKEFFIAVHELGSTYDLVDRLKEIYEDCDVAVTPFDEYSVISFSLAHRPDGMQSQNPLTIIFDRTVPAEAINQGALNVLLYKPDGRQNQNIPEYSPISFASLHKGCAVIPGLNKAAHSGTLLNTKRLDDDTENLAHERAPSYLKDSIMQARMDKNLTEAQLAALIEVPPHVIKEYESGKATPDQQIISKLETALVRSYHGSEAGVHLT